MALIEFQNNQSPYINADNLNNNFDECKEITESGSNANGSYIKYSDGTMICYKTVSGTADISTAWGSLYSSSSIDLGSWPVSFISRPVTVVNTQNGSGTQFMLAGQSGSGVSTINLCGTTTMIRPNSRTGVSYLLDVIGIGRWK